MVRTDSEDCSGAVERGCARKEGTKRVMQKIPCRMSTTAHLFSQQFGDVAMMGGVTRDKFSRVCSKLGIEMCAPLSNLNSAGMSPRETSHLATNSLSGQMQSQVVKVRRSTSTRKSVAEGAVSKATRDILMKRPLWARDVYG